MGVEIERKFLVVGDSWKNEAQSTPFKQGYILNDPARNVRVRRAGEKGKLTIKGATKGLSRTEYEYEIPVQDAEELLRDFCEQPLIEKTRYKVKVGNHIWEVDEFHGLNSGLVLAEVELASEDETFEKPEWLGEEVSSDHRYFNAYISQNPYSTWNS